MSAHKHTQGPWEAVGWYVRTPMTASDGGGWLVADLSGSRHLPNAELRANASLIAAAPDHALICWAMCVGAARWEPWGDKRGEFCMNGLRHATELDEFGCPVVTGMMRAAIAKAMGDSK